MASGKLLILRRPPPGLRFARPEDRLRGRPEGRPTLIQAPVDFLTASKAGVTINQRYCGYHFATGAWAQSPW